MIRRSCTSQPERVYTACGRISRRWTWYRQNGTTTTNTTTPEHRDASRGNVQPRQPTVRREPYHLRQHGASHGIVASMGQTSGALRLGGCVG